MELQKLFEESKVRARDIKEHLDFLKDFCIENNVKTVLEYGTREGFSTTAFLAAGTKVTCVDLVKTSRAKAIMTSTKDLEFIIEDTAVFKPTKDYDLFFVDTLHTYSHVKKELLWIKDSKTKPTFIVFHDTVLFGKEGENDEEGILRAIEEFIKNSDYTILLHRKNNNGLMVLKHE